MPAPTAQQASAISARGNVLVMAGAGAGKTSTLVARILDRVLAASERVPLDRLLVVTFNEAAAAEMRHRLVQALDRRRQENPDDSWIAESLALVEVSWISTLHAFCLRLVREHFQELGLDPRFVVLDESEARVLRRQVLDEVMRGHYRGEAPEADRIRAFLDRHGQDGDQGLRDWVTRIHDYARSLPSAESWLAAQLQHAAEVEPRMWRAGIEAGIRDWIGEWREHVESIAARAPDNLPAARCADRLSEGATVSVEAFGEWLDGLASEDHAGNFPRGKVGLWRKPLEHLFGEAAELRTYFGAAGERGDEPLRQDWSRAREDLGAILTLAQQFMTGYEAARRGASAVDFSDLEQLALRLLWNPGEGRPTDLARRWQTRFDQVLVDEYQDINGAQDCILTCLSRTGARANRFLVGDVKQSIYRFRRADPRIFQGYAAAWRRAGAGEETAAGAGERTDSAQVLPLSENFRSHEAVLEFVNAWFSGLMREDLGGVGYGDEARLRYGAPESRPALRENPEGRVELHLYVAEKGGAGTEVEGGNGGDGEVEAMASGEDLDAEEAQAGIVARRLRAWHEGGLQVRDSRTGSNRPATWKDMVILHPGPRPVGERWARRFAAEGIPLDARRGGFLDAQEVSDVLNLARLLDNPSQDVPLLAVLRSPFVGMTVDELSVLRLARRDALLWEALEALVGRSGDGLMESLAREFPGLRSAAVSARAKAADFRACLRRWRELAREGSLASSFETVLGETDYEAWLEAQPGASSRLANVRRLIDMARRFDAYQRHGLFRFLRWIEAYEESGAEIESAPAASGDSVRLLSMHQSKGLEFPVVVVAGLGRRFNTGDLHGAWLLDEEYGLCPPVLAQDGLGRYPSLPRWLAGKRQRREYLGEQARLLYVACTRAMERLVLVGQAPPARLESWAAATDAPTRRELVKAGHPLEWLGPRVSEWAGSPDWAGTTEGARGWFRWHIHRRGDGARDARSGAAATLEPVDDPAEAVHLIRVAETLEQKFGGGYGWYRATREAGKSAVTALRKRWAEVRDDELEQEAAPAPAQGSRRELRASDPDAIERGLVHHLFFELFDLNQPGTEEALRAEAGRMCQAGWLREEQVALLDFEGLAGFWGAEVGASIRAAGDRVQRELPFTARLRPVEAAQLGYAEALSGMGTDDFQVLQGVVDLAVLFPEEIWLVDYKTDRVFGADLVARAAEYRVQIALYAHALTAIYRRPVTRRWLYFLAARQWVAVD